MIKVKKLPQTKWREYRDLRLEALKTDPTAFGASYEEEKAFSPQDWKSRIKNVLFAVENDLLVGMIVYKFLTSAKTKHIANIFALYVTSSHRSRGVGKILMQSAIAEIKKNKKIVKINLNVNPEQKAALKLYKSFGFRRAGVLKKDLFIKGKYYDEWIMEKHF